MRSVWYWLLHWSKRFCFLHLSSYINSRSVSLSECDKSRTLFSDVERKSAWHNRLTKWITSRIAKRCVADVAFSRDKKDMLSGLPVHLRRSIWTRQEGYSCNTRVSPDRFAHEAALRHSTSLKSAADCELRPWRVLYARFDDDSLNLSIDYGHVTIRESSRNERLIYKYYVYEITAWLMWFHIPC